MTQATYTTHNRARSRKGGPLHYTQGQLDNAYHQGVRSGKIMGFIWGVLISVLVIGAVVTMAVSMII